jgi:hypothetical protein
MIKVATRPQWVLLFLFVMVVAGVFAWLGQWQVGRAIEDAQPVDAQFETVIPLDQLTPAGETTPETAGGHMTWLLYLYLWPIKSRCSWLLGDWSVHHQRRTLTERAHCHGVD